MRNKKTRVLLLVAVGVAVYAVYQRRPMRYHPDGSPCAFGEPWVTKAKMVDADGKRVGHGYACHGCTQEWVPAEAASA